MSQALDVTGDLGVALEGVPRAASLADAESAPEVDKVGNLEWHLSREVDGINAK